MTPSTKMDYYLLKGEVFIPAETMILHLYKNGAHDLAAELETFVANVKKKKGLP